MQRNLEINSKTQVFQQMGRHCFVDGKRTPQGNQMSLIIVSQLSHQKVLSMRRRRRQVKLAGLQPQQSNIFFSKENEYYSSCTICYQRVNLPIKPCACNTAYHDSCLLKKIQRDIIRQIKQRQEMDISTLKCPFCNSRFHIHFTHQSYRSCDTLCQRLSDNCCNKYIILLSVLLVIIIVTVTLCFLFISNDRQSNDKKLKYGLISACVIEALVFILLAYTCLEYHLTVRRLVLYKVYDMTDPELRSIQSQNSDDNKVSQQQQIIIRN